MALSNPRIIYGVHSLSPYNRTDKMPYGILKVIGSASIALSSDQELLYAGSNKFPWAAEGKTVSTEFTAKVKAYPDFLFSLFLGATVTQNVAESGGSVTALTNKSGTSIQNATNGVSSISIIPSTGAANLKFGKYVVRATAAATLKIYKLSDIDKRGASDIYVDDSLEIATIATVVVGTNDVASIGIRFTGVGTPAFVVGATATFEVRSPNTQSTDIIVGQAGSVLPNFGCILLAQKRATSEMFEIDAPNCVGAGLPMSFEEQAFSQPELKMTMLYDSAEDKVMSMRHIQP